jgi:hypothetical protein
MGLWSLRALTYFSAGFWRPVSASKKSVPGGHALDAKSATFAPAIRPFGDPRAGPELRLFRIESERLKLSAPFCRRIAKPLDADAAGQATFYGCFDKIGCKEGE